MSEIPIVPDQREMPFGDYVPDMVTSEQYGSAVEELLRFAEEDVDSISSLIDLNDVMDRVGLSLLAVLQSQGGLQVTEFGYRKPGEEVDTAAVDRAQVFRRSVGEYDIAMNSVTNKRVYCSAYTINSHNVQRSKFIAQVPVSRLERSGNNMTDMMGMYAVDWRSGTAVQYYPLCEPHNTEVCRGYAGVVRDFARNVLESISDTVNDDELPSTG